MEDFHDANYGPGAFLRGLPVFLNENLSSKKFYFQIRLFEEDMDVLIVLVTFELPALLLDSFKLFECFIDD